MTYPTLTDYIESHREFHPDQDAYDDITEAIVGLLADIGTVCDLYGSIELGATKGIYWSGFQGIGISGGEIQFTDLDVTSELIVDDCILNTATVTGDVLVVNDASGAASFTVSGSVTQDVVERDSFTFSIAAEPGDPAEDTAIIWLSNGTGYGDLGDLCAKITEAAATTSFTLTDYSGL